MTYDTYTLLQLVNDYTSRYEYFEWQYCDIYV